MITNGSSNSFTTKDWVNSIKDVPVYAYNPTEVDIEPTHPRRLVVDDTESITLGPAQELHPRQHANPRTLLRAKKNR